MNHQFQGYATKNSFALFPLRAGTKDPFADFSWTTQSSGDPAQWNAWQGEGANLAIYAAESRLIIVDIDVKELGRDRAWALWCQWCSKRGLNASDFQPHVNTASNGWHIFFRVGAEISLSQRQLVRKTEGSKKAIVETRAANGYVVAPGSRLATGETWTLISDAAPHDAPQALIDACSVAPPADIESFEGHDGDGLFDFQDISDACDVIAKHDGLSEEQAWCESVWAIRDYFGTKGYPLAEKISYCDDRNRLPSVWNRRPNKAVRPTSPATILAIAKQCRREHMFDSIFAKPSPPLVPEALSLGVPLPGPCEVEYDDEPRALSVFSAASFEGLPIPTRKWHVRDLIPGDTVTLLYGDGGTGKSLIALQLLASTAVGCAWLGRGVQRGSCLFITAEDSRDEVHMRLVDVARAYSVPLSAMPHLHIVSLAGEDAIIAAPEGRSSILTPTALFAAIEEHIATVRPALVVLDTLADLFGGNEIDRSQARQFIGMLRGLALTYQTAILLLAHPSVSGMAKGTGASGSTGWNNSVRSRLYFDRIRAEDNSEPDPDARVLRSMKSNYGPVGTEIVVHWQRGVFVAERVTADGLAAAQDVRKRADDIFVKLLMLYEAEGRGAVSPNPGSNYAPKLFADHEASQGFKARALKDAMDRLLASRRIETIMTGPPSRMRQHLIVSQKISVESQPTNAVPTAFQGGTNAPTNGLPTPSETLPTAFQRSAIPTPYTPVTLARP